MHIKRRKDDSMKKINRREENSTKMKIKVRNITRNEIAMLK